MHTHTHMHTLSLTHNMGQLTNRMATSDQNYEALGLNV